MKVPETLGDIAEIFYQWKEKDITREAVEYVIDRVWWEDVK